jgi:glycosyltransferase involved in cell wall biosynthesis
MNLSLVIPCFNEAQNLPLLLPRCAELARVSGAEVVLVDNGSTDDTPVALEKLLPLHAGCRSVRVAKNQGYGFGILEGLRAAHGDVLAWTHADMQTNPLDAARGLEFFLQEGPELFVKGRRHGRPLGDRVFTLGMSIFETTLLGHGMWDINAQPTMFARRFFETWREPPHDFSLDLYAYYQARRMGIPVRRFPVVFGQRAHGASHWNINWATKWKFIRRTVSYSLALRKRLTA